MKIKQLIILSFCLCGLAACEDIYKGGEKPAANRSCRFVQAIYHFL